MTEGIQPNGFSLPTGPLTENELQALRRIIRDEDRARWFWREARRWGGYGAALIMGVYASWDFIVKLVTAALQARGSP